MAELKWQSTEPVWINCGGSKLEGRCWGPSPRHAPTLVLLHEGLGSIGLWKHFPGELAERTGYGVFAYSRGGYGHSDPVPLPLPLDYMTREAMDVLPRVLDMIGFQGGVLLGHSDGASIAALHAGGVEDLRVRGLCLMSPHFFTETEGLASIATARVDYETGDLRARLAKYHADPDRAFRGWNEAWLDPGFKSWNIEACISRIQVPVLAIQGRDDHYGTLAQIDTLKRNLGPALDIEILDDCRHSPHFEQKENVLSAILDYLVRHGLV